MNLVPTKPNDITTRKQLESDLVTDILNNRIAELEKNSLIRLLLLTLSSQLANNNCEVSNTKVVFTNTGKNCCNFSKSNKRNETNDTTLSKD